MITNYYCFWQKELRKKIVQCDICKNYRARFVHHIDKNRTNNENYNLQLLCRTCHKNIHYNEKKLERYNVFNEIDYILSFFDKFKKQFPDRMINGEIDICKYRLIKMKQMKW